MNSTLGDRSIKSCKLDRAQTQDIGGTNWLSSCPCAVIERIQSFWDPSSLACMVPTNKQISSIVLSRCVVELQTRLYEYWTQHNPLVDELKRDSPDPHCTRAPEVAAYADLYPHLFTPCMPLMEDYRASQCIPASLPMPWVVDPRAVGNAPSPWVLAPILHMILDAQPRVMWYSAIKHATQPVIIVDIHPTGCDRLSRVSTVISEEDTAGARPVYVATRTWCRMEPNETVTELIITTPSQRNLKQDARYCIGLSAADLVVLLSKFPSLTSLTLRRLYCESKNVFFEVTAWPHNLVSVSMESCVDHAAHDAMPLCALNGVPNTVTYLRYTPLATKRPHADVQNDLMMCDFPCVTHLAYIAQDVTWLEESPSWRMLFTRPELYRLPALQSVYTNGGPTNWPFSEIDGDCDAVRVSGEMRNQSLDAAHPTRGVVFQEQVQFSRYDPNDRPERIPSLLVPLTGLGE
jgi:hypothetical protein